MPRQRGQVAVRGREGRPLQRHPAAAGRPRGAAAGQRQRALGGGGVPDLRVQKAPGVHVIGDATASAPGMPKSGFHGQQPRQGGGRCGDRTAHRASPSTKRPSSPTPATASCLPREAVHVASVHKWSAAQKTLVPVKGAGGLSAARNELEGVTRWTGRATSGPTCSVDMLRMCFVEMLRWRAGLAPSAWTACFIALPTSATVTHRRARGC
jgi:hypothetical protein